MFVYLFVCSFSFLNDSFHKKKIATIWTLSFGKDSEVVFSSVVACDEQGIARQSIYVQKGASSDEFVFSVSVPSAQTATVIFRVREGSGSSSPTSSPDDNGAWSVYGYVVPVAVIAFVGMLLIMTCISFRAHRDRIVKVEVNHQQQRRNV